MKGINVKKIAAFAGAAVLFGAAAVFADVTYGTTQLVDQNGQPTVKIYVGSHAQISDGVAAANIAAKIANEAYKSSTLTASGSIPATACTVGTGVSGAGTCSIVETSKKVTLEVTVPGTIAGVHTFKTLITDTIDRTLQNRITDAGDDIYPTTLTASDTATLPLSPVRGSTYVTSATTQGRLYKIGAAEFTGFADYSVVDDQAVSTTYTESQNFWIGTGNSNPVAFDPNDKEVEVNKYDLAAYSLKFSGNDYGIPVCTGDLGTNTSDDWTSCGVDSNSRTAKHRVKIKFMGAEWIISEMSQTSTAISTSATAANGGLVKLAKEAKYGIINVGGILDTGTFKIRLSDISVAVGTANTHPAILDILDTNDAVIGQVQVDPGTTYTFTQSGTGNSVKIHVYKTAPGFTLNAKWAEMAIYTDEITLQDGARYNQVSSTATDKDFYVSLLWKNKDYTGSSGGNSTVADSLREITLYQYQNFVKAKKDDVYNFLKSTPTFKLSYDGVDLQDSEYVPLTFTPVRDTYTVANVTGDVGCANTVTYTNARWIQIQTSGNRLFGGSANLIAGNQMVDTVYFDPIGLAVDTAVYGSGNLSAPAVAFQTINGTGLTTANNNQSAYFQNIVAYSPILFWQVPGSTCYNWAAVTYNSNASFVRFDTAGDNSNAQGKLFFADNTTSTNFLGALTGTYQAAVIYQEDAGKINATTNNAVKLAAPVVIFDSQNTVTATSTYKFLPASSTQTKTYYLGLPVGSYASAQALDLPFITERGSKVVSVSSTGMEYSVAKRVGMPTFTFSYADTSIASSANEYTLGVGDSQVFGGVTVKVKSIDANAGSCSVLSSGGTPSCTVDTAQLVSMISPDNTPTVTVTQPYALSSNLVALDTQSAGTGVAIVVGGPMVNSMAVDLVTGASVDFNTDNVVVKEIGNKILVAGLTAQDTIPRANRTSPWKRASSQWLMFTTPS